METETMSIETKAQSVTDIVMDYEELMSSEPAWTAHVYMVEYVDAKKLYSKALNVLKEMTPNVKQEYLDFMMFLKGIEESGPFDLIYLEKESARMDELLERLIGELAIMSIYIQKSVTYNETIEGKE